MSGCCFRVLFPADGTPWQGCATCGGDLPLNLPRGFHVGGRWLRSRCHGSVFLRLLFIAVVHICGEGVHSMLRQSR